jgi:hypothetical protein
LILRLLTAQTHWRVHWYAYSADCQGPRHKASNRKQTLRLEPEGLVQLQLTNR